jgi:hypothetical protein
MKTLLTLFIFFTGLTAYSQDETAFTDYFAEVDGQCKTIDSLITNHKDKVHVTPLTLNITATNGATGEKYPETVKATGYFYNGKLIKVSAAGTGQGLSPEAYKGWYNENFYFSAEGLIFSSIQCQNPPEGAGLCEGPYSAHRGYFRAGERYNPKTFSKKKGCSWPPRFVITKATADDVMAQAIKSAEK